MLKIAQQDFQLKRARGVRVYHFVNFRSVFCIIPVKHIMNCKYSS
jgi:hypothetical protein